MIWVVVLREMAVWVVVAVNEKWEKKRKESPLIEDRLWPLGLSQKRCQTVMLSDQTRLPQIHHCLDYSISSSKLFQQQKVILPTYHIPSWILDCYNFYLMSQRRWHSHFFHSSFLAGVMQKAWYPFIAAWTTLLNIVAVPLWQPGKNEIILWPPPPYHEGLKILPKYLPCGRRTGTCRNTMVLIIVHLQYYSVVEAHTGTNENFIPV